MHPGNDDFFVPRCHDVFDLIGDLRQHYDLVILDCPPNLGALTAAALLAADHCLVPLQAEELAYRALPRLFDGLVIRYQGQFEGIGQLLHLLLHHKRPFLSLNIFGMAIGILFGNHLKI